MNDKCPYCSRKIEPDFATLGCPCGGLRPHRKVEPESGDGLLRVLRTYGLLLPANAIEWRVPPGERRGSLPSLSLGVELLVTDGIVAWFLLDSGTTFFGHLANFEATASPKAERAPRARKTKKSPQDLLDLI